MKVLHLSFHKGCIDDLDYVCKELGIEYESLCYTSAFTTNKSIEPMYEPDNQYFNCNHKKAEYYWKKYEDYFNQFDCIITSDTAPLSRIFLQNNWNKKLIIWICNRFNYTHRSHQSPPDFPDQEYYELFRKATTMPNVKVYGYTYFENVFCKQYDIDIGENVMRPSGLLEYKNIVEKPQYKDFLFVVPYHNENKMMDLTAHLLYLNIKAVSSSYDGAYDLRNYKAIIHIPYAPSNFALFEAFQVGLIYFIPSFTFLSKLFETHPNHFFIDKHISFNMHTIIEWYNPEFKDLFVYFDSWDDFVNKYNTLDYDKQREKILEYGKHHKELCLGKWRDAIFS